MSTHTVDLNQLLADVVELHRGQMEQVDISLSLDSTIGPMKLDSGRMRQVFNNLIVNAGQALKQTDNARLVITTLAGSDKNENIVTIQVEDNGPGIRTDLLERLFEPYVTSKEKGSGLGLAIVKKIIDEHGGTIWVKNMKTGGSCFTIQLPVKMDRDNERSEPLSNRASNE
jgi:signal transduction histidine kinase